MHLRPHLFSAFFISSVFLLPGHNVTADSNSPDKAVLHIGKFSKGQLDGWKQKAFEGETQYSIVTDTSSPTPRKVLKASSHHAASGLFMEKRIDLEKNPWIHWSWKTDKLFSNLDESRKSGDDFVARVYVIVDGGIFFWNTRALNYVWSSSHSAGEAWPNPFTSNATMFAVESGNKKLGQWQHYSRNVRKDLKKLTGKDVRYIDAVAVMTDTDNAGQQATTYYGDIYFTSTVKTD